MLAMKSDGLPTAAPDVAAEHVAVDLAAAGERNVANREVANLPQRKQTHAVRAGDAAAADGDLSGAALAALITSSSVLNSESARVTMITGSMRDVGERREVLQLVLRLAEQHVGDEARLEGQQIMRVVRCERRKVKASCEPPPPLFRTAIG
jgi:hypothetical protein